MWFPSRNWQWAIRASCYREPLSLPVITFVSWDPGNFWRNVSSQADPSLRLLQSRGSNPGKFAKHTSSLCAISSTFTQMRFLKETCDVMFRRKKSASSSASPFHCWILLFFWWAVLLLIRVKLPRVLFPFVIQSHSMPGIIVQGCLWNSPWAELKALNTVGT